MSKSIDSSSLFFAFFLPPITKLKLFRRRCTVGEFQNPLFGLPLLECLTRGEWEEGDEKRLREPEEVEDFDVGEELVLERSEEGVCM
jgi:hypothetical protein